MECHNATTSQDYKIHRSESMHLNSQTQLQSFLHSITSNSRRPFFHSSSVGTYPHPVELRTRIIMTCEQQQRSFLNGLSPTVRVHPPADISFLYPDSDPLEVMVKLEVVQMPFSTRADWRICWKVLPKAGKAGFKDQDLTRQLKLFQNIDQHGNVSYINWGAVTKHVDRSIAYALTFDIDTLDLTRRDQLCKIAYETSVLKSMDAYGPRRRPGEWVRLVLDSAVAEGILSSEKVDAVLSAVRRSSLL